MRTVVLPNVIKCFERAFSSCTYLPAQNASQASYRLLPCDRSTARVTSRYRPPPHAPSVISLAVELRVSRPLNSYTKGQSSNVTESWPTACCRAGIPKADGIGICRKQVELPSSLASFAPMICAEIRHVHLSLSNRTRT